MLCVDSCPVYFSIHSPDNHKICTNSCPEFVEATGQCTADCVSKFYALDGGDQKKCLDSCKNQQMARQESGSPADHKRCESECRLYETDRIMYKGMCQDYCPDFFASDYECVEQCPKKTLNNRCVDKCPSGYDTHEGLCLPSCQGGRDWYGMCATTMEVNRGQVKSALTTTEIAAVAASGAIAGVLIISLATYLVR